MADGFPGSYSPLSVFLVNKAKRTPNPTARASLMKTAGKFKRSGR